MAECFIAKLPLSTSTLDYVENKWKWKRIRGNQFETEERNIVQVVSLTPEGFYGFANKSILHFGPNWHQSISPNFIMELLKEGRFIIGNVCEF